VSGEGLFGKGLPVMDIRDAGRALATPLQAVLGSCMVISVETKGFSRPGDGARPSTVVTCTICVHKASIRHIVRV